MQLRPRVIVCTTSLLVFLASEGLSHHRQIGIYRTRSDYPYYGKVNHFETRDCTEDRCPGIAAVVNPFVPRPGEDASTEPISDGEDLKQFWEDLIEENDLGKRAGEPGFESIVSMSSSPNSNQWTPFSGVSQSLRSLYETKTPNCTCKARVSESKCPVLGFLCAPLTRLIDQAKKTIDMGPQKFPRYLDTFGCDSGSCAPSYSCKEITFKTWVLRLKRKSDGHSKHVPLLPENLRDDFTFEPIEIAAGCECFQQCDLN